MNENQAVDELQKQDGHPLRVTITWIVVLCLLLALIIRAARKSEDPARLIFRWLLTAPIVWYLIARVGPVAEKGGLNAIDAILRGLVCGGALLVIWRHQIGGMIAKPFGDIYDGGDLEVVPRPFYSIAQAERKRGKYPAAIAEIWRQLEKFPNDFDGQLMMAEIQAENMNDVAGADLTIHRLCDQPGHAPRSVAFALNSLADWHMKFAQDREAAKKDLEEIIQRLPDSEMAAMAAQRIGHLADNDFLLSRHDRKKITLGPGVENIGLLSGDQHPKAPETNPAKAVEDYVKHLESHPLDTEVREKLALLYAEHYGRLELASEQLDQMIAHPNQPAKRVVHWLNLLADLQVRYSCDYETVRKTLQRIVDLYPTLAAAQQARDRLSHLKLEIKGKQKIQTVKLGSYEQNVGLKGQLPDKL